MGFFGKSEREKQLESEIEILKRDLEILKRDLEYQKRHSDVSEETGYICKKCGAVNSVQFMYCPYCGTKNLIIGSDKNESSINTAPIQNSGRMSAEPEDEDLVYLKRLGLLDCAQKQYTIYVQLENGQIVSIPLLGKERSRDALEYLRRNHIIPAGKDYCFSDWPRADSCIGPRCIHLSACVCELPANHIYHVESYRIEDMRTLYGCPNPKSISYENVLDRVQISVVDYEK